MTARCNSLRWLGLALPLLLGACAGRQSALSPGGQDAAQLYLLFLVMLVGAVLLWIALNGLFFYVTRINRRKFAVRHGNRIIIGAGVILPTVLIGALLAWGLSVMPAQRAQGDGLVIRVTGEEWWWRVEYWPPGAEAPKGCRRGHLRTVNEPAAIAQPLMLPSQSEL